MKPATLDVYHKHIKSIFKEDDPEFYDFFKTTMAEDLMKEMKEEQKRKYYLENPSREDKKIVFEIEQEDLRKIWLLGQAAEFDAECLTFCSYFWNLLCNIDRPAEKLKNTQLRDMLFNEWRQVYYFVRDPSSLATKVKSPKTRRSFGVLCYIPSGPTFQPYNLLWVRLLVCRL